MVTSIVTLKPGKALTGLDRASEPEITLVTGPDTDHCLQLGTAAQNRQPGSFGRIAHMTAKFRRFRVFMPEDRDFRFQSVGPRDLIELKHQPKLPC